MKNNTFTALNGAGLKIGIVASRFNQELTDAMLDDCRAALATCGVADSDVTVIRVPGSFELPGAAARLLATSSLDAVICLGVIIKGDTYHDEVIAYSVGEGLVNLSLETKKPVIFGVLTTMNREQAETRSIGGQKKGWEAGMSAIETVRCFKT